MDGLLNLYYKNQSCVALLTMSHQSPPVAVLDQKLTVLVSLFQDFLVFYDYYHKITKRKIT